VGYAARKGLDSRLGRTDFLLTADTMAPEVYLLLSLQQQPSSAPGLLCNERQHAHARRRFDTRAPAGSRGAARGWGGLRELEAGRRGQAASPFLSRKALQALARSRLPRSESRPVCTGAGFVAEQWQRLHTMVRLLCAAAHRRRCGVHGVLITPARGVCAGAQAAGE